MKYIFIILNIITFYNLIIKRKQFDIFTFGYLSSIIYFSPAFLGFTTRVSDSGMRSYININNELYYIYISVILIIGIFVYIFDKLNISYDTTFELDKLNMNLLSVVSSAILLCVIIAFLVRNGSNVLGKSKLEYIENLGVIYQVLRYCTPIVFGASLLSRNKFSIIVSIISIIIDLYMSNRTTVMICTSMFILNRLFNVDRPFIKYKKLLISIILSGLFLMVFERVIEPIQKKDWLELNHRLTNINTYIDSIIVSEPFVTQTILEEVIDKGYSVKSNTYTNILNGKKSETFNSQFQKDLFPDITKYRMAENIWAEGYSNYKWIGVVSLIIIYPSVMFILNLLLYNNKSSLFTPLIYISSINWCFFIHRGSLINQLMRQKNSILVFGVCIILTIMTSRIFRLRKGDN